jgi:hypothetical protein
MLPLDSDSRGPRFYNVSAHVDTTGQIHLSGVYDGSDLIPVLLFSVGAPWVEPCLRHVCCLWDVIERYRDRALMDALGDSCDERVNLTSKDLMKGNGAVKGRWEVNTMIHPSFVAMLFLCLSPVFYMYYEIVPMEWEAGSAHWSSAWYGQPCHQVQYTDGRKLCIYCANEKPENAQFVFTPNWFQTFQCKWKCNPGFMGPGCELSVGMVASVGAGVVGVLCVSCVAWLVVSLWKTGGSVANSKKIEPPGPQILVSKPPLETPRSSAPRINDVISFKDEGMHEIRIKLL